MKHNVSNLIFIVFLIFINNCDTTEPKDNTKQEGVQEHINWPSLSNSPWPMHHHDPQNTGRSCFNGPQQGIVDLHFDTNWLQCSVVMGSNDEFYFAYSSQLFSYNINGDLQWSLKFNENNDEIFITPLVSEDGTIFVGLAQSGIIYAVSSAGAIIWEFNTNANLWQKTINIGLDGSLYFIDSSSKLYCLNSSGQLIWSFTDARFYSGSGSSISFSNDGKTLYIPGINPSIISFNLDSREVSWTFGTELHKGAPLVDSQGHIYFLSQEFNTNSFDAFLYSLNPDGTIRWAFKHNNPLSTELDWNSPTIDKSGNLYFAFDTLYSVDYNGNLRWKEELQGYNDCPLVCDQGGNVYVGLMDGQGMDISIQIKAFSNEGTLLWNFSDDTQFQVGGSPAIFDNHLIFPTWRSTKIFLFK
ncbi:MAG: PQQ-binding-like beta-propeller repeat protein [Bacteroidetes bacterium]|nr:PQQ-binding-like beta-propeller repeat protein [Bacteroidota bacterium]